MQPCSAPLLPCPFRPACFCLAVRLQYRNPWGEARIGRILEDLDSLAGFVAFDHWWAVPLPLLPLPALRCTCTRNAPFLLVRRAMHPCFPYAECTRFTGLMPLHLWQRRWGPHDAATPAGDRHGGED